MVLAGVLAIAPELAAHSKYAVLNAKSGLCSVFAYLSAMVMALGGNYAPVGCHKPPVARFGGLAATLNRHLRPVAP